MNTYRFRWLALLGVTLTIGMALASSFGPGSSLHAGAAAPMAADDPKTWKELLNEKELKGVLDVQLAEINDSTKSPGKFKLGYKKVERAGAAIAILGNAGILAFDGEMSKKCATLRDAGVKIVEAAAKKDLDAVKAAAEIASSFPAAIAEGDGKPAKWDEIATLDHVMKNVSSIDSDCRKATAKSDVFSKDAKDLAHQSTLLAVLAVVSREHNKGDDWKAWCDEMRDGSIAMSKQFAKKSQPGSKDALKALQKSCTDCHEVYRKEE